MYECNTRLEIKKDGQLTISCHSKAYYNQGVSMRKFRQLTFVDRIYIEVMHWERKSNREIAKNLGVHPSTISRELKRGQSGELMGYRADLGERHRRITDTYRGRKQVINGDLESYVQLKLKAGWSPEQISGRLKLESKGGVGRETIYNYVKQDRANQGGLYLNLRRGRRRRKKRFSVPRVRADILNRLHIKDRPSVINERERVGDWERDLVFGDSRSSAMLTFVDRKSLLTRIAKVASKSPKEIEKQTIKLMEGEVCKSITNDNGFEFRNHESESQRLEVPIYFTNPYASWEKGTNENTNGLIRQYFPKRSSMKELTDEKIKDIENRLNTRPRKKLSFQTPLETHIKGTA
jgi:IS30 family transposase